MKDVFKSDRFSTRSMEATLRNRPTSIYASTAFCLISTAFFTLVDFTQLFSIFNAIFNADTSSYYLTYATALVVAAILDIPLAIAAQVLRGYMQGMECKKHTVILVTAAVISFAATFAAYVPMRLQTSSTLFETNVTSDQAKSSALFFALLPAFTSLGSFTINFFASDPLMKAIFRLEKSKVRNEARKTKINEGLAEGPAVDEFQAYLLEREDEQYKNACDDCDRLAAILKQKALLISARQVGTVDACSAAMVCGETTNNDLTPRVSDDSEFMNKAKTGAFSSADASVDTATDKDNSGTDGSGTDGSGSDNPDE